ncbi:MAG: PucR family transcriptional regulator [Mycobacterium sp.]
MAEELPSPRVRDLIRQCAQIVVNARPEWLDELDRAVLAASPAIAVDPELAAAVSRSNRANLYFWATANVRDPGAPVPPNSGPEPLSIARELVRRGMNTFPLDAYRVGEGVAWRRLMEIAFELTSDAADLHELLQACSRSISAFVDATLIDIATQIDLERDELTHGSQAERRETIALLLDGAPIPRARAEQRLGYALTGSHTAAVIWTERHDGDLARLDRVTETIGRMGGRPLSVLASSATRWVWIPGSIDMDTLETSIGGGTDIRVAVGTTGDGVDGFRRSHFEAITTQQMVARLHSPQQVARFTDVEMVSLVTTDPDRTADFVSRVLGDFAAAGPELQDTVRVFVASQCNASRAAARLYTHRNTLLRRLARAEELLPLPLAESSVSVAVALDVLRWTG